MLIVMQFKLTYYVVLNFYISGLVGSALNHNHAYYGTVIWLLVLSKLPKFGKPSLRTTSYCYNKLPYTHGNYTTNQLVMECL